MDKMLSTYSLMLSTLKVQKNTRNSIPLLRSNTFHAPCLWGCVGLGLEWLADIVDFVSLGDLDETLQCLLDVLHTLVLGLIIRGKSKKIMSWRLLVYCQFGSYLWQNCSADSSHSDLMDRLYIENAGSPVTFFLTWRKGGSVLAISSSLRVVQVSSRMRPWHLTWHGAL